MNSDPKPARQPLPKPIPQWVDALWLGLLSLYILAGTAAVPFHGDESTLIFMGRDYYYQFIEADLSKILYASAQTNPTEEQLRLLNGTFPKTIYGWLAASSGYRLDELNAQWDWMADYEANQAAERIPAPALLMRARLASALQLALALLAFYVLVRRLSDRPTAYAASALFALHPSILLNGRRAMMESSHLLGMLLLLLAGIWLMHERRWWQYLLLGAAAGLAVAAKHPNALIAAIVFFACFSHAFFRALRQRSTRLLVQAAAALTAAALIAPLLFLLLNPAWWSAPLTAAEQTLTMRTDLLRSQIELYGGYASANEQLAGFFQHVFVGQPQFFEVAGWADYAAISEQVGDYAASGWAGIAFGASPLGGLALLLLTASSSIHFVRRRQTPAADRWFIAVWGSGIITATLLLTPLPWSRYYLPVLPFVLCMAAYGITTLLAVVWTGINTQVYGFTRLD